MAAALGLQVRAQDAVSAAPFGDTGKQSVRMAVPDTLLNFNYKFNYSVFDSPYKGAYEFSPYFIDIRPEASVLDGKKLFLRAGAGYSFHPELDFAYAPIVKSNFALSVFADAGGYSYEDNRDLGARAGVNARWNNESSVANLYAVYDGIFTGNKENDYGFHSGDAGFNIKSIGDGTHFHYDLGVRYYYTTDDFTTGGRQSEHFVQAFGSFGPVIKDKYRILLDFGAGYDMLRGVDEINAGYYALTPKVQFILGSFNISAGAKFDYAEKFRVAPAVDVDFSLLGNRLTVFAGVKGGQTPYTYRDMRMMNHRYLIAGVLDDFVRLSFEKFNAFGGIRGSAGSSFEYKVKAGYASVSNAPVYSTSMTYVFEDYKKFYAELSFTAHSERVDVTGKFNYDRYTMQENTVGFTPPEFSGLFTFRYNWARRIFAGISVDGRSKSICENSDFEAPGFVDLGVNLEYRLNRKWGVWAKGGNLACMKIQRIPGFEEKGIYGTVGFSLVL